METKNLLSLARWRFKNDGVAFFTTDFLKSLFQELALARRRLSVLRKKKEKRNACFDEYAVWIDE